MRAQVSLLIIPNCICYALFIVNIQYFTKAVVAIDVFVKHLPQTVI